MDKRHMSVRQRWEAGKGSRRRPTDEEKFRNNYDRIKWDDREDEGSGRVQRDSNQSPTR